MNHKMTTVALALASGALGALASRFLAPTPVFAQPASPTEIRAHKFTLLDSQDKAAGAFTVEPAGPFVASPISALQPGSVPMRLIFRDSEGREIWSARISK